MRLMGANVVSYTSPSAISGSLRKSAIKKNKKAVTTVLRNQPLVFMLSRPAANKNQKLELMWKTQSHQVWPNLNAGLAVIKPAHHQNVTTQLSTDFFLATTKNTKLRSRNDKLNYAKFDAALATRDLCKQA